MSPAALGLALSLHALAAAVLWWATPLQPVEPVNDALMITVDSGAPPTTMDQPPDDKPAPPAAVGTPDPAPPKQPREELQQALADLQPPQPEQPLPQPTSPRPSLEQALAPPEELPPPTAQNFPKPVRPAARPPPPPPQGVASQAPPRPTPPAPARPPARAPASVPGPPSNSSDWLIGKSRARNTYLDQVARHTSRYRFYPRISADNKQEGRVVTRVTIGRDGRLIDVRIGKSSGWPAIDAAELETIRRSAPFPPVPTDMPGDPLILNLPINYELPLATRSR
ncbi:energy transducer TonB [Reyranella sp.]|uniref:energy transducer TonB n=1 Tax=Reyranella sp. TaxID=1929291 RepID=UPI0027312DDB|nr:energy transducer TonB [Reyranella sp.]MDP2374716.1 energy transducer TonB [Reyranella sp.]